MDEMHARGRSYLLGYRGKRGSAPWGWKRSCAYFRSAPQAARQDAHSVWKRMVERPRTLIPPSPRGDGLNGAGRCAGIAPWFPAGAYLLRRCRRRWTSPIEAIPPSPRRLVLETTCTFLLQDAVTHTAAPSSNMSPPFWQRGRDVRISTNCTLEYDSQARNRVS